MVRVTETGAHLAWNVECAVGEVSGRSDTQLSARSATSRLAQSICQPVTGQRASLRGPLSHMAGGSPPVCAKVLLTIHHRPSILARLKKSINETLPQNPSSATVARAASPTCVTDRMRAR